MKKFEIVIPLEIYQNNKKFFHSVFDKHCVKWCMNEHHKYTNPKGEEVSKFDHQHIGGWLTCDNTPDTISKWFGNNFGFSLQANNVQKIKGQWPTYCLYIGLHYMQPDKEPITLETTHFYASDGTQLADLINIAETHKSVESILNDIAEGKIKEFEILEKFGTAWYRQNYKNVETALKVYQKSLSTGGIKNMKSIMWVFGSTGTGKTTLATTALSENKSCFIASDSNPLDDYKGEPVLILDDISDGTLTSKALLKLLDPNYNSPQGARYYNKMVTSETIIITSTISPQRWWQNNRQNEKNNGDYAQLLRRLNGGVYHIISDTEMELTIYDGKGEKSLMSTVKLPKSVTDKIQGSASITLEDRVNNICKRFNFEISEDTDFKPMSLDGANDDDLPFN